MAHETDVCPICKKRRDTDEAEGELAEVKRQRDMVGKDADVYLERAERAEGEVQKLRYLLNESADALLSKHDTWPLGKRIKAVLGEKGSQK